MSTKRLFVVLIKPKNVGRCKVSQEAYYQYDDARKFIIERKDSPVEIEPFIFESEVNTYIMYDVYAKE